MKNEQLNQLLYEVLETEIGGVQVYQNAIECAVNDEQSLKIEVMTEAVS